MTKNTKEWLWAFGLPTLLISLLIMMATQSLVSGLFSIVLLMMGGILGVYHGLTSPFFAGDARLQLIIVLMITVCLVRIGWQFKHTMWGKVLVAFGFYLWCGTGAFILGITF